MIDLISRQAAINILRKHEKSLIQRYANKMTDKDSRERGIVDGIAFAIEDLDVLPSAQPDVPDTNVGDTISRQAAIETVRKAQSIGQAHRMLIQLQSAQKYGMWIVRYFGADAKCSECGMYCVGAYDHDRCDQYCRCCGAKMDGLKLEGEEP